MCGRIIVEPAPRDLEEERGFTRHAAEIVGVDPEPLIAFAELRALPGGVRDLKTRDFLREGLEEMADLRNYLVWYVQQLCVRHHDGEEVGEEMQHALNVLGSTVALFEALRAQRGDMAA